ADYFRKIGLQPLGKDFQFPFEFNSGERVLSGKTALQISTEGKPKTSATLDAEFRPLSFSDNGSVEGNVVFAGYGLTVPEGGGGSYNSYTSLEVKDKVVLILRYVPENVEPSRRAQLNRYAGLRYKAMLAREHGAKAILVVTGPNSPNPGEVLPL